MSNPLRPARRPPPAESPLRRHGAPTIKRDPASAGYNSSRLAGGAAGRTSKNASLDAFKSQGQYKEYTLKSCSAEDVEDVRHHILKFHSKTPVVPMEQFTEPVRFHRKDPRNLQYQLTLREQQDRRVDHEAVKQERVEEAKRLAEEEQKNKPDMSVVAPDGNGKRAQPFKKKTRQIHTIDERERKLRYEEYYPWVMEDFEGKNTWVGSYEAAQSDCFVLFVFDSNGFKMVPAEKWYKMTPRNKYPTLTAEEAEQKMEIKKQPNRWVMKQIAKDQEDNATNARRKRFVSVQRGRAQEGEADREIDYEEEFADDEEAPIMEGADDEVKEVEDRIKKEHLSANSLGLKNEADVEEEEKKSSKMDKAGRKLRKYLRSLEKNTNYSSDDEDANPYASEEESDSDEDLFNAPEDKKDAESPSKIKKEEPSPPPLVRREKKIYNSLPPGFAILQLHPQFLGKFQQGVWNPNAKRPREEDIQPAPSSKKLKTERLKSKSSSPSPLPEGEGLLTESEVISVIRDQRVDVKGLLKVLNPKLHQHPDNRHRLQKIVGKVARLSEGFLVLKKAAAAS